MKVIGTHTQLYPARVSLSIFDYVLTSLLNKQVFCKKTLEVLEEIQFIAVSKLNKYMINFPIC